MKRNNLKDLSDAELWAEFQSGTVRAFNTLHERHSASLVRWLMARRGANRADAEDVAQGAWMRAYRNRHSYTPGGAAFRTWLFTIAKNLSVSRWKRRRRETPLERTNEDGETYIHPEADRATTGRTPDRETHGRHFSERAAAALNELPERQSKPLRLRLAGAKYREIADELDTPLGTIKSRIYRARRKLRDMLGAFRTES